MLVATLLAAISALLTGAVATASVKLPAAFINENAVRSIDLTRHAVREKRALSVAPAPDSGAATMKKNTGTYWLAVEMPTASSTTGSGANFTVAHVSAHEKDDAAGAPITLTAAHSERQADGRTVIFYPYTLLNPSARSVLIFDIVYTHALEPFPRHAAQTAAQLVKFVGNAYLPSPYVTRKQKLKVTLPANANVKSFTEQPAPAAKSSKTITYGPYEGEEMAALSHAPFSVHFEHSVSLITVSSLQRDLWLSLWGGNLAVDEYYAIRNDGPQLEKPFSRIDYSQSQQIHHTTGVLKSLRLDLPPKATEPYFRDDVGNVSTSNFRRELRKSVLEMRPRFPVFGGWIYNWHHGYNVPLSEYLKENSQTGQFVFEVPFVKSFENAVIDSATVRVVLPEGAVNVRLHLPYEMDDISRVTTHTYLDSVGRTTVVLTKHNLVDEHMVDFQVSFEYAWYGRYAKPLFLATGSLIIYAVCIAYWHSNFAIGGGSAVSKADKTKAE